MTAKFMIKSVDSLAVSLDSNAILAGVHCSDIDTTGKSNLWKYVYYSWNNLTKLPKNAYYFTAQNNHVVFDSLHPIYLGVYTLVNQWIDSDSAMSVSQRIGGSDIRRRFPTCTIAAYLYHYTSYPFIDMWNIDYKCSDSTRTIIINATTGVVTSVNKSDNQTLPIGFELYQNYPNPFNPSTSISFSLPARSFVSLKVFDLIGREVTSIVSEELSAGKYMRQWSAKGMPSGVYFYRIQAGSFIETKKFVLLK
jgi:Secretion system C-terminal sorting domain